jgi:hypothetical protein
MAQNLAPVLSAALHRASQCSIGLVIKSNDIRKAKAQFYEFRKSLANPDLARLQIRFSPTNPDQELWIINMGQDYQEEL